MIVVDAGGNTEFADMRAAYDALDDKTKAEIEDLVCEHSLIYSRGTLGFTELSEEEKRMFAPVRQRLVRMHPVSGRKSLYLSSHIGTIIGWPVPEARAFIRDLTEHAMQPRFTYAHKWRQFDLVMWDNRVDDAPGQALRRNQGTRHAPHHGGRGQRDGGAARGLGRGAPISAFKGLPLPCYRLTALRTGVAFAVARRSATALVGMTVQTSMLVGSRFLPAAYSVNWVAVLSAITS